MNIKTTVILAVLLLGLGAYMFFTRETGNEPKKVEEHKLVDVSSASNVNKVTVTGSDGKVMTLEKKGADWRMVQPVDAPADSAEVTGLIDSVINLKSTNEVDAGSGAKTGLDKPQYVVELSGSKNAKVSFGDKLAVGNGLYTKVDGKDRIDVVDAGVLEKLDKAASTYRQSKLVETPSLSIQQLVIDSKNGKLSLQKQGADWQMTEPQAIPADSAAVTDLLNALTGLKATSFVEDPSEQADAMKGSPPVASVSFSTAAASTQPTTQPASAPAITTVAFGAYDDVLKKHVYAKVTSSPFIAKVDTTAMNAFNKKPIDLRDKRVINVPAEEVSRFTIKGDIPAATQPTSRPAKKTEITIVRRGAGGKGVPFVATTSPSTAPAVAKNFELPNAKKESPWVNADGTDVDETEVREFLTAMYPLKADRYLESNPATTQPNVSRYTVSMHTEAAGGAKAGDYVITFMDRGNDQPLIGDYNGLTFEAPRFTLSRFLEGDFKNKGGSNPAAPPPGLPLGHP